MSESAIPSFPRGVRFQFDAVRDSWVVLAPERLFIPDEPAVEILKLVDGKRTINEIVDDLAARYAAPREVIAADVTAMLKDLAAKGALSL